MLDSIRNLIFPSKDICLICKEEARGDRHICMTCRENLEVVDAYFHLDSPHIEDAYYSLFYNRFIRQVIKDYKYHGKNYLYKALGEIMIDTIRAYDIKGDRITYIPMHYRKEAIRGYNQARLLSLYISNGLNLPLIDGNLLKYKNTKDQSHSDRFDRMKNQLDSFRIKDPSAFKNQNILLVDDIITTGATMKEVSRLLMQAGAKKVSGIALTSSKKS